MQARAKLLVGATLLEVCVLGVDVVHRVLNAVYQPFHGPLDDLMHLGLGWSWVPMSAWLLVLAYFLVTGMRWGLPAWVGWAVVTGELGLAVALPVRDVGSSEYLRSMPPLVGGVLVAVAVCLAARPVAETLRGRFWLALLAAAWSTGPLVVGVIDLSEGGGRGEGPLWRLPVVGEVLGALAWPWLLASIPLAGAWGVAWDNWPPHRWTTFGWWLAANAALALTMPAPARRAGLLVFWSSVVLFPLAVGWSCFVAD